MRKITLRALVALLALGLGPVAAQTYSGAANRVGITQLPTLGVPADNDLFIIEHLQGVPGQHTNSIQAAQLASYVLSKLGVVGLSVGTVTTLAPGAPATASIGGTYPNQIISLGIPAGASGSGTGNVSTTGTPAAGKVAYFPGTDPNTIAPGGPAAIGAAARGANSDITGLSGLTTPLSVGQGGTGAASAPAALASLGAAASGANADITSLASPALGAATAATPAVGDATTRVATTAFVAANAGGGVPLGVSPQSAAYTVQPSDKGRVLQLTGSFALTGPAASSGFSFWVSKRDGGGVVTFTPASGTIDGRASLPIYQEGFLIWCDGTNWFTVGRPHGWVNIGSFTLSASVASVSFSTGFTDPELREMELDFNAGTLSANGLLYGQLAKGGSMLTAGYVQSSMAMNNTNSVVGSGSSSGYSFSLAGSAGTPGTPYAATVNIANPTSTTAISQRVSFHYSAGTSGTSFGTGEGFQNTAAAITSFAFTPASGTFTAGNFNHKGFRS